MMTSKQKIEEGEKLFAEYDGILTGINEMQSAFDLEKAITLLLKVEKIKIAERREKIKERLDEKKKEYLEEFEKLSQECNLQMNNLVAQAKTYFGKEPIGISAQMEDLVKKYEEKKSDIEQEEKNFIYEELKGHCRFMKKKSK